MGKAQPYDKGKKNFKNFTGSQAHISQSLNVKSKKSFGHDGISSQVLKIGAKILVIPLTFIINSSILTAKFPTNWKIAKVIPLYKKGDKKVLKNYRPVFLLSVDGMVLEKVVAMQIEDFFEENKLFGSFQFGFRKNKSTVSEMLTVFDTLFFVVNV